MSKGTKMLYQTIDVHHMCTDNRGKRLLKLCIDRCKAENFSLRKFELDEIPYSDEEIVVMLFFSKDGKNEIDFHVYRKGYAIPVFYDENAKSLPNLFLKNTVRKAIRHIS